MESCRQVSMIKIKLKGAKIIPGVKREVEYYDDTKEGVLVVVSKGNSVFLFLSGIINMKVSLSVVKSLFQREDSV